MLRKLQRLHFLCKLVPLAGYNAYIEALVFGNDVVLCEKLPVFLCLLAQVSPDLVHLVSVASEVELLALRPPKRQLKLAVVEEIQLTDLVLVCLQPESDRCIQLVRLLLS